MSLIIFFGMALFIFVCGSILIGVTIRHWIQQSREQKQLRIAEKEALKRSV
ncbi:hypothetical protein [Pseudobdellovibrio exovorus]|uniref:Uncharacterized protein n=1 Tax=Pseudobdellovibrio exovorus JSS TaxID=1184267 RepID=M4V758_9BACT|nr:hypothetical protein [Pseudobdellovibrio exovorus]AGH95232.1 hypothetical protein A11Q_1016 [Pseudobdellovibrio exovorus JSS]